MPPAASIFANRTNGLVSASMGWVAVRAEAVSRGIVRVIHYHFWMGNCNSGSVPNDIFNSCARFHLGCVAKAEDEKHGGDIVTVNRERILHVASHRENTAM